MMASALWLRAMSIMASVSVYAVLGEDDGSRTAVSASDTCSEAASAVEYMAMVLMLCCLAVRMMRT